MHVRTLMTVGFLAGSLVCLIPSAAAETIVCSPGSVPVVDYQIRQGFCAIVGVNNPPQDCPGTGPGQEMDPYPPSDPIDTDTEGGEIVVHLWVTPASTTEGTLHVWVAYCGNT